MPYIQWDNICRHVLRIYGIVSFSYISLLFIKGTLPFVSIALHANIAIRTPGCHRWHVIHPLGVQMLIILNSHTTGILFVPLASLNHQLGRFSRQNPSIERGIDAIPPCIDFQRRFHLYPNSVSIKMATLRNARNRPVRHVRCTRISSWTLNRKSLT